MEIFWCIIWFECDLLKQIVAVTLRQLSTIYLHEEEFNENKN